jgi:hypothetical protein
MMTSALDKPKAENLAIPPNCLIVFTHDDSYVGDYLTDPVEIETSGPPKGDPATSLSFRTSELHDCTWVLDTPSS